MLVIQISVGNNAFTRNTLPSTGNR